MISTVCVIAARAAQMPSGRRQDKALPTDADSVAAGQGKGGEEQHDRGVPTPRHRRIPADHSIRVDQNPNTRSAVTTAIAT